MSDERENLGNIRDPMKHTGLIRNILKRLRLRPGTWLYDEAEGEAIVAMVRSIKKHDRKKGQYNTYAGRAAYNAIIGTIKKYRRYIDSVASIARAAQDEPEGGAREPDSTGAVELMYKCIDLLDDIDKKIIIGMIDGKSMKELSKSLGISYEAVKMRCIIALNLLRNLMYMNDSGELDGIAY